MDSAKLLKDAIESLKNNQSPANLMTTAVKIAQTINNVSALSGSEKKNLVILTLTTAVEKLDLSTDDLTNIVRLIKEIIPPTLDIVISVAHGHYILKKYTPSCFSSCWNFLSTTGLTRKLTDLIPQENTSSTLEAILRETKAELKLADVVRLPVEAVAVALTDVAVALSVPAASVVALSVPAAVAVTVPAAVAVLVPAAVAVTVIDPVAAVPVCVTDAATDPVCILETIPEKDEEKS